MALTPIKGTIINLDDVFVRTEDGVRYVTDRYSLWRLDELAGRSKLHDALALVPDGSYTLLASGAVKAHPMYSEPPMMARLMPAEHDGAMLEDQGVTIDYKRDGLRLWLAADGGPVALDSRFKLDGYTLHRHASGLASKPVSVLTRNGDVAGIIMPIRPEESAGRISQLAARIESYSRAQEDVA